MFGFVQGGGYIKNDGFWEFSLVGGSLLNEGDLYHMLGLVGNGGYI